MLMVHATSALVVHGRPPGQGRFLDSIIVIVVRLFVILSLIYLLRDRVVRCYLARPAITRMAFSLCGASILVIVVGHYLLMLVVCHKGIGV